MKFLLYSLSSLLIASSVYANEIYVNQVGDNLELSISQDGQDNVFQFCSTDPDDSNCVDSTNTATGWASGYPTDGSIVSSSVTGDDNTVLVSHGGGSNIRESYSTITGNRNTIENFLVNPTTNGGLKESTITITGDDNFVRHNNDSYGAGSADITVSGDDNSVTVYQRAMSSTATVNVTNAGGPVTANIQQLGSSYQDTTGYSTTVTQYCTNANGCSVSLTQ